MIEDKLYFSTVFSLDHLSMYGTRSRNPKLVPPGNFENRRRKHKSTTPHRDIYPSSTPFSSVQTPREFVRTVSEPSHFYSPIHTPPTLERTTFRNLYRNYERIGVDPSADLYSLIEQFRVAGMADEIEVEQVAVRENSCLNRR